MGQVNHHELFLAALDVFEQHKEQIFRRVIVRSPLSITALRSPPESSVTRFEIAQTAGRVGYMRWSAEVDAPVRIQLRSKVGSCFPGVIPGHRA